MTLSTEAAFALGIFALLGVLWVGYIVIDGIDSLVTSRDEEHSAYDHYLAQDEEDDSEQGTPPEQRT